MSAQLYIHILWPNKLRANDLRVFKPPTSKTPGLAQLNMAHVDKTRPDAPNSLPLKSGNGTSLGYVANTKYLEKPYKEKYIIASYQTFSRKVDMTKWTPANGE